MREDSLYYPPFLEGRSQYPAQLLGLYFNIHEQLGIN